jgi:predicted alpha/beta hydrolase
MQQPVSFKTDDGTELSGLMIKPKGPVKIACVVHSATGVPKEFYLKFASWLSAEHDAAVLIYDYRGFGGSLKGPIKNVKANMSDWGVRDASAALDYLIAENPKAEIWAVGHSLGGMFLNAHRQSSKVARAFSVAAGANHWTQHPISYMPTVTAMWWLAPAAVKTLGYLPGKKAGLGADLPEGVYWQWRKWCLSKEFLKADLGKDLPALEARTNAAHLKMIAIEDDRTITPPMVRKMAEYYPGAKPEFQLLTLKQTGTKEIGHIGVFREANKKAWPLIIGPKAP